MALNATWHRAHPMPKNATWEQRVAWHREHARECGCRTPPPAIAQEIARREAAGTADGPPDDVGPFAA